jgi:hypothetical protein
MDQIEKKSERSASQQKPDEVCKMTIAEISPTDKEFMGRYLH